MAPDEPLPVHPPAIIDHLLAQLAEGRSLTDICERDPGMPTRRTIGNWQRADAELAAQIREAREEGFHIRAERAVEAAKKATDANLARIAFDAERWYLGKLSNAFAEKPIAIDARVLIGHEDAFATVAEALNRAASTIAGGGDSTSLVAPESPPRPTDA